MKRIAIFTLLTALAAIHFCPPARADITVVKERTLTGSLEMGATEKPVVVTTFYKGERCREEYRGSSYVHLYDAEKDLYYTLNRIDKTYSVSRLDDALAAAGFHAWASLKVAGPATLTDGGGNRDIAAGHAINYNLESRVTLTDSIHGATVEIVQIDGEQWNSDTLVLPSKSAGMTEVAFLFAPRASHLLQAFLSKTGTMKGLPLSSDFILTLSGSINGTFEAQTEVKAVSETPLPDSMFNVPSTYQLVDRIDEGGPPQ